MCLLQRSRLGEVRIIAFGQSGIVIDVLFKVQDKNKCWIEFRRLDNWS